MNEEERSNMVTWNSLLIQLIAEERADHALASEYPLLGNLFYGDYTAVMGILSGYSVEELFSQPNPLIVGTVAEGFESRLVETIKAYTTRALAARPDLAEAYFLRGWAHYLENPTSTAALEDVQQAADLAPEQPLIAASVDYLSNEQPADAQDDTEAIIATAQAYMQQRTGAEREFTVVVEKQEGDYARVSIADTEDSGDPLITFLKRENGVWSVVADTSEPSQSVEDYRQYGIPETLLDEPGGTLPSGTDQAIIAALRTAGIPPEDVTDFTVEMWGIEDDFARVRIVASHDDERVPITAYLQQQDEQWTVLEAGTTIDEAVLQQQGIPPVLIAIDTDIKAAARRYVQEQALLVEPYYVEVEAVDSEFARVMIESADTNIDPTIAFLRRTDGTWTVISYGTAFGEDFYERYSIPESVRM
jgi:hypothetical protein